MPARPVARAILRTISMGACECLVAARSGSRALNSNCRNRRVCARLCGRVTNIGCGQRFDSHKLIEEVRLITQCGRSRELKRAAPAVMFTDPCEPFDLRSWRPARHCLRVGVKTDRGQVMRPRGFQSIWGARGVRGA